MCVKTNNLRTVLRIFGMMKPTLALVVTIAAGCGGKSPAATSSKAGNAAAADTASVFGPLQDGTDYLTYTKVSKAPFPSPTHGGRDVEVWVNAVGLDAYKQGAVVPVGTVLVKTSTETSAAGTVVPGPLFVMAKKAPGFNPDGKDWSYALYWEKPSAKWVKQLGGPVYWRTPSSKAAYCIECHENYDNELGGVPDGSRAW